jgi:hypothetical protein
MAYITSNLPNLVLTTSGVTSTGNAIFVDDVYALGLSAPSALTGTITIQVEPSSSGTNFQALQSGGDRRHDRGQQVDRHQSVSLQADHRGLGGAGNLPADLHPEQDLVHLRS